jgi:hypothetical protein
MKHMVARSAYFRSPAIARAVKPVLLSAVLLAAFSAVNVKAQQIGIANPLIRPKSVQPLSSQDSHKTGVPSLSTPIASGVPVSRQTAQYPTFEQERGLEARTPTRDVSDHFTGFSVTAIIGRDAVLRKVIASGSAGGQIGAQAVGANGQLIPQGSVGRPEVMHVTDSQPIQIVGDGLVILPKVTPYEVALYLVQDKAAAGKKPALPVLLFKGSVDASGSGSAHVMPDRAKLERPDANYTRRLTVQVKSSASAGASTQGNGPNGNSPDMGTQSPSQSNYGQ